MPRSHLRSRRSSPLSGQCIHIHYLEFFCTRDLPLFTHLLIQSCIHTSTGQEIFDCVYSPTMFMKNGSRECEMPKRGHKVKINPSQRGALTRRKCICLANSKDQEQETSKCWTMETGVTAESPKPKRWESCVRSAKTAHPPHAACQQERKVWACAPPGQKAVQFLGTCLCQKTGR